MFGDVLSTVFTVIKLPPVTVIGTDKTSPELLTSDWSATAAVVVFVITLPIVPASTVADKVKLALFPFDKVPIDHRPELLL